MEGRHNIPVLPGPSRNWRKKLHKVCEPSPHKAKETEVRKRLLKETMGRCWYCGGLLAVGDCTVDHVTPKRLGGRNGGNLVAACYRCNHYKGELTLSMFKKAQGCIEFWGESECLKALRGTDTAPKEEV